MQLPICDFDAKNSVLCPQCESKIESGAISKTDVDASIILAQLAKTNDQIDRFSLSACEEFDGNYVLYLSKENIQTVRQSRTIYRTIQEKFPGKIWIVESKENYKKFIEDLFFPTKILSVNSVWESGGTQKTKAIVAGKWTSKFPINLEQVIHIVKNACQLDVEIEFEDIKG